MYIVESELCSYFLPTNAPFAVRVESMGDDKWRIQLCSDSFIESLADDLQKMEALALKSAIVEALDENGVAEVHDILVDIRSAEWSAGDEDDG